MPTLLSIHGSYGCSSLQLLVAQGKGEALTRSTCRDDWDAMTAKWSARGDVSARPRIFGCIFGSLKLENVHDLRMEMVISKINMETNSPICIDLCLK